MYRVKTLLVMATVMLLATSLFAASGEILPFKGEYQPSPFTKNYTRDTDVVLTNLEGITVNTNFGGWTKDYFLEMYVPPADGYVNSIDFNFSDLPEVSGGGMSVWIYQAAFPWEEVNTEAIADAALDAQLGYYDEATGFENVGTNWVKGGVNDVEGADPNFNYDPLGPQAWPAFGSGSMSVEPNADDGGWVNYDLQVSMGTKYDFTKDTPFVVVVKFNGFPAEGDGADYRMGFLSGVKHIDPQPAMKFYSTISSPNGRMGLDDWGWYIRSYVWDWNINATLTGDRGPQVYTEELVTTLSTASREVTAYIYDDNPSGGSAGVGSATLMYTIDGGSAVSSALTAQDDTTFVGTIPGQAPGTEVTYWVEAEDVNGNAGAAEARTYSIFEAMNPILLVYDTDEIVGLEWYYMYATPDTFNNNWDLWEQKFGQVNETLLTNYEIVIHVMGGGPYNDVDDVSTLYADWLAMGTAEVPRRLMIMGQDYGVISGFADTTFPASAFENMYLGVETLGPQDINYDGTAASYEDPYAINAVASDETVDYLAAFEGDSLQLFYWPAYEVGFNNWIDNMTLSGGTATFTDPNNSDAPVAVRHSGTGWMTAFWTIDNLALDYMSPADTSSMYHWALTDVGNPITGTLEWFGAPTNGVVAIDNEVLAPANFKLHAAYPNPFNPVTNIAYELATSADVSITVYNMLGQEVANLVNGFQNAGNYTVQWNGLDNLGHSVPSGLYFYEMATEGFSSTHKMMLIK